MRTRVAETWYPPLSSSNHAFQGPTCIRIVRAARVIPWGGATCVCLAGRIPRTYTRLQPTHTKARSQTVFQPLFLFCKMGT